MLPKPIWKNPNFFSKVELEPVAKWMHDKGSFTKKIKALATNKKLTIKVLREALEVAKEDSFEFSRFNCRYIYSREIQIFLDDHLLMYARSVMPKNAAKMYRDQFRGLGKRPLADILFSQPALKRSSFEFAKILSSFPEYFFAGGNPSANPYLWARRSIFSAAQDLLLLTEFFSPDLVTLILRHEKHDQLK